MRKMIFRLLIAGLALSAVALACTQNGVLPITTDAPTADQNQLNVLMETAQVQLLATILPASEASQAAAAETKLTFPERVATAVAATQAAEKAGLSMDEQIQTAIAETQAVSDASAPGVQTAISQTQVAQGLTQVALLRVEPNLDVTPSVLVNQAVVNQGIFNGGYVYRYGFLTGNKYLITLQFPGSVSEDYYAMIGGKDFTCKIVEDYPNRLYCTGPSVRGGSQTVQLFENNTNRMVFNTSVVLPQWTPTKVKDYYDYYHGYPNSYCVTPCPEYGHNSYYKNPCSCGTYWGECSYCKRYDYDGKCYYYDKNGVCRYCKTGNKCR